MTKKMMQEIDQNLLIRSKVKDFFGRVFTREWIKSKQDDGVISGYLHTLSASHNDLEFYLIQLYSDEFFTDDEIHCVMDAFNNNPFDNDDNDCKDEDDGYYDDSDELQSEIEKMKNKLQSENDKISDNILKQKELCKNRYELYILQHAAFALDYILFDETYEKFN